MNELCDSVIAANNHFTEKVYSPRQIFLTLQTKVITAVNFGRNLVFTDLQLIIFEYEMYVSW